MRWKTSWKAAEQGKRKAEQRGLSVWTSELRVCSQDTGEHSLKTHSSHMWPAALLGPYLWAAESATSSRNNPSADSTDSEHRCPLVSDVSLVLASDLTTIVLNVAPGLL